MTINLQELAKQIAQLQGSSSIGTTVSVGISQGLLRSALEKRNDKAQGGSILFHYRSVTGLEMRFADKTLEADRATKALESLHAVACEHGSVLELRGYMSFELIQECLEWFEEYECSYAQVSLKLLEDRIEAKKAKSQKEEGKMVPSLNLGTVTAILDFSRANNPMADSGELATEEELVFLIQEQAERSRKGYDVWKQGVRSMGQTEGQAESIVDQSATDLA